MIVALNIDYKRDTLYTNCYVHCHKEKQNLLSRNHPNHPNHPKRRSNVDASLSGKIIRQSTVNVTATYATN